MGNAAFSTLGDAAEQSDRYSPGFVEGLFPWTAARAGGSPSAPAGGKGSAKGRRRRDAPHSAFEASEEWGDIDTTKVDLGTLAPRILEAQKKIPVDRAREVHCITDAHGCYVRVLVWDPFRDLLISGGGDGWVRFWSTEDYGLEDEVDSHISVRALLVLTRELASGHHTGEVLIWDMESPSRRVVQSIQAHREAVYSLAMLRSGELVTGAEDVRVFVRTKSRGFELAQVIPEEVLCMCTAPSGGDTQVITGNMTGVVLVWDTAEWNVAACCEGHSRAVWALCYVRDKHQVASGSADHTIRIWETGTWRCLLLLRDHTGWVVGLSFGPGWLLSCSSEDKTARAWNVADWNCARVFMDHDHDLYTVCAFAGGRFAVAGSQLSITVYGDPADAAGARDRPPGTAAQLRDRDRSGGAGEAARRQQQPPQRSDLDLTRGAFQERELQGQSHSSGRGGGVAPNYAEERAGAAGRSGRSPRGRPGTGALLDGAPLLMPAAAAPRPTADQSPRQRPPPQAPAPRRAAPAEQPQQPPRRGDDEDDLLFETKMAVQRYSVPQQVKPRPKPRYAIGDSAWVFSTSQGRWLRAQVVKSEGEVVTVAYRLLDGGEAQKQLLADDVNLRPADDPPPQTRADGAGGASPRSGAGAPRPGLM